MHGVHQYLSSGSASVAPPKDKVFDEQQEQLTVATESMLAIVKLNQEFYKGEKRDLQSQTDVVEGFSDHLHSTLVDGDQFVEHPIFGSKKQKLDEFQTAGHRIMAKMTREVSTLVVPSSFVMRPVQLPGAPELATLSVKAESQLAALEAQPSSGTPQDSAAPVPAHGELQPKKVSWGEIPCAEDPYAGSSSSQGPQGPDLDSNQDQDMQPDASEKPWNLLDAAQTKEEAKDDDMWPKPGKKTGLAAPPSYAAAVTKTKTPKK